MEPEIKFISRWQPQENVYRIMADVFSEDGIWCAVSMNFPGVASQGDTFMQALENLKESATGWIESYIADGHEVAWASDEEVEKAYRRENRKGSRVVVFVQTDPKNITPNISK